MRNFWPSSSNRSFNPRTSKFGPPTPDVALYHKLNFFFIRIIISHIDERHMRNTPPQNSKFGGSIQPPWSTPSFKFRILTTSAGEITANFVDQSDPHDPHQTFLFIFCSFCSFFSLFLFLCSCWSSERQ